MATRNLTVTRVTRSNGVTRVLWSDGVTQEFRNLETAKEYVRSIAEDLDVLRKLALARYLFLDPNGNNPNLIEGRTITVTNESNTMVTVS